MIGRGTPAKLFRKPFPHPDSLHTGTVKLMLRFYTGKIKECCLL